MHVLPCSGWRFSSTALSIASKKIWLAHASQNGIGVWCSSHERGLKNVKAEGVVPRHAAYPVGMRFLVCQKVYSNDTAKLYVI